LADSDKPRHGNFEELVAVPLGDVIERDLQRSSGKFVTQSERRAGGRGVASSVANREVKVSLGCVIALRRLRPFDRRCEKPPRVALADGGRHLHAKVFSAQLCSRRDPAILVGQTIVDVERYLKLLRAQQHRMSWRCPRAGWLSRLRLCERAGEQRVQAGYSDSHAT